MNLVIFDIDGTLTDTNKVDLDCYYRALEDEFQVPRTAKLAIDHDLVTDTGFAIASFRHAHGRNPDDEAIRELKLRFMFHLRQSFDAEPSVIREVKGAATMMEWLKADENWCVAIATGCWLESATFKLENAKLFDTSLPIATCDDSPRRSEIVSCAVQRSLSHYKQTSFDRIVAVGDRPWDLHVAGLLRHAFIGVESDGVLTSLGADSVVRDYSDHDTFMRLLRSAVVPHRTDKGSV
jgi:phosphoglycolate phosphatase-like HAD superfamily hydrolase